MKVLVAPLDWGLGHATRCVPVVKEFMRQGAEVELAVVKANADFFREVFPSLRQRVAPGYNIVYPKHGFNMALWLLKNSGHLNSVMRYEHRYAEEMVERHGYDVLFSDNRFAFYSRRAYSIYMTHQRRIAFPQALSVFEGIGIRWHHSLMKKFDEVWVPDDEKEPGYAGTLSHVELASMPVRFVGPLSRFSEVSGDSVTCRATGRKKRYKVVAVVSGVEPARSQFEKKLRNLLAAIPGNHLVILGKPQLGCSSWTEGNVEFCNHLPTEQFATAIGDAEWVVSRGGYSTVMDMAYLGAKCVFVPTPGQYEQVNLARHLASSGYAVEIPFAQLSAETLLEAFKHDVELPKPSSQTLLHDAVKDIMCRRVSRV